MKKLLLVCMALFLYMACSWGQSAIIGTGTSTTNGSIADPIERYYNYEHYQIVYTAAELAAAGMPSGAIISALGFSVTESAVSLANFTIDMGLTAQTLASPYIPVAGLTNVRSAFTYAPVVQAAGSFDMIPFTTNFTWDGTSNIVVNTCTGSNPFTSPYGGLRYTAATSGAERYIRTDNTSNCATATGTNTGNRPNIRFDYTGGSGCSGTPAPGNTISSINPACYGVSFTLSLQNSTSGSGVTYQWQTSPNGLDPWTNVGTSTPTYTTSQTTNTYYHCKVTCSGNTGTSTPLLVTTNSFGAFTEDFELAVFPPTCWALANVAWARLTTASSYGLGVASVKADFYNTSSGNFDLITPVFDLTGIADPYIVFDHAYATYSTEVDKLEIWTSVDYGTSYTLLQTLLGGAAGPLVTAPATTSAFLPTSSQWLTKGYSLPAGTNKVRFRGVTAYGNNLFLDMIKVQSGPPIIPAVPGLWKGTVDTDWDNIGNWDDGVVPTAAINVTIPSGCPNYPNIIAPATCNNLTIAAGGTLNINGGTLSAAGKLYVSAATAVFNISSGILNVGGIFQTGDYTWSNGVFNLSGGIINMTGTAFFYGGSGSTMSGTFTWNVGGTLQIDNAMWTMTGGTINLLGTETSSNYFLPPTGTGTATAYNLVVNSGASQYLFSRDATVNNDAIVNNFTILSGTVSLPSALGTGNPGTFTVGGDLLVAANSTANLTIPAATTFTVTGNTYQALKSVTGYGSIIGYINGQYNFNVEIEGLATGRWILISPPVPGLTAAMFGCQYLQKHDPIANNWTDVISPLEPLVPGVDYALWVHPDALTGGAPCSVIAPLTSFIWAGIMNNGPVVTSLLCDDPILEGWNNVGNPYQATIDWNAAGWTKTNVNDAIYLENNGLWASYVAGVGANGGTQYIAPNQGFFVQCNAIGGGSLGFDPSTRTHTRAPFFKSDVANLVRLQASGNNRTDETVIRFTDEATAGFDGNFDARKFNTSVMDYPEIPQIYSTANGNLSINSLPATEMVAVGFKAGIAGNYTINATESSDFTNLVLEDLQTNTFTDLLSKSYTFSHELGNNDSRFILHFTPLAIAANQSSPVKIYASQKDVYVSVPANTLGNFKVFNLMGQEVATARIDNMVSKKSIGESGIYIVKVIIGGQVFTQKVIIQ